MTDTFIGKAVKQVLEKTSLSREELAYKVLPGFFLDLITKYLRVRSIGLHHIPDKGPYILVANHSGYMGFDALMLEHQVRLANKPAPRIIAHKMWFIQPEISVRVKRLGLVPATYENGLELLKQGKSLILFPEGEEGNFKPSSKRYHLRRFRRGFIRLALATGAPIIPAVIIGAEETHITLSQIRWAKEILGIIVPIPLNVIPLPAKWKIQFLKPICITKDPERVSDIKYATLLSRQVRIEMQKALHKGLVKRKTIYL